MEKGNPRFSIIVPIYNVANFLHRCVRSVLDQSYKDFELILVDDGSPDDSPSICDSFSREEGIKVIHKQNEGLVRARQTGVAHAIGEYVVCLDGDDWLHLDFLKKMASIIDTYRPDVICCGRIESDGIKERMCPFPMAAGLYKRERMEKEIFPYLIENRKGKYFPPSVWAKCFKRIIYQPQQLLVDSKVQIGEDMACTRPTIANSHSIYIVPKPLYYYRKNPTSMTKAKKAFLWEGAMLIGKHQEKTMNMSLYDFQNQNYRFLTHNLFLIALSQFNRNEPYFSIRKDVLKNLNAPYYRNAIKKAKFDFLTKGNIARICLRYKLIFALFILNKLY